MRAGTGLVPLVAIIALAGGVAAYELMPVRAAQRQRVVCPDPAHVGSRLVGERTRIVTVPRFRAGRERVVTTKAECPVCLARRMREASLALRRDRGEAPPAEPGGESALVMGVLKVDFRFRGSESRVLRAAPGDVLDVELTVQNHGKRPVRGLGFVIGPREALAQHPPFTAAWEFGSVRPDLAAKRAKAFQRLTVTGWPIVTGGDRAPTLLLPYDSVYNRNAFRFSSENLKADLALSPKVRPGRDVHLTATILADGKRAPAGTLTVHVLRR